MDTGEEERDNKESNKTALSWQSEIFDLVYQRVAISGFRGSQGRNMETYFVSVWLKKRLLETIELLQEHRIKSGSSPQD